MGKRVDESNNIHLQNLEFLFNHTKDVIWSVDRQMALVCGNKAFNEILEQRTGKKPLVGQTVLFREFGDEYLALWGAKYQQVFDGETLSFELEEANGISPFVEIKLSPIKDEEGNITGAACFATDITPYRTNEIELKQAHQKIKNSEERYRTLIQSSQDIVLLADENGNRTYISPSIKTVLGYEPEELLGQPVFDHVHPDDLPALHQIYSEAVAEPSKPVPSYVRFMHKNGEWRHLHITGSNQLSNPAVGAMVANIRDVTELVEAEANARKNEIYFRSLTENYPNGAMSVLGLDFKVRYAGGEDFSIFQIDPKSMLGVYYPSYYGADKQEFLEEQLGEILKGKSVTYELPFQGHHYLVSGQPLYNNQGQIQEIILSAQNISNKKHAEDALRESEEKFRMLSENSPIGIFQAAPNGYCTWMNERMCEICGFENDEGLGFGYVQVFHPDDKERMRSTWFDFSNKNQSTPLLTYRLVTKKGKMKWAYTQATPIKNAVGEVIAYVGTIEDISDLKHYQDELLASRDLQEKILNSMPDGMIFLDNDWTITYANNNTDKILGFSKSEMLGWNMWERFPGSIGTSFYQHYLNAQETKAPFHVTDYYEPLKIWLEVNCVPSNDGFLVYFRNVTDKVELEHHIDRIYQMSPAILGIVNHKYHFVNFNPALGQLLGYTEQEIKERPFYDFVHPDDRKAAIKSGKTILNTPGFTRTFENRYITKTGDVKWVAWSVYGQPERNMAYFVALDITEKKNEENYLRLLQSVVTNTQDSVVITEANEIDVPGPRIVYVNDAFTKTTGYSAEEAIGQSPRFLQGRETNRVELAKLKTALKNGKTYATEVVNYTKDGKPYWVSMMITPALDTEGIPTHFISIQRDITDIKEAELKMQAFARQQESLALLGFALISVNDLETIYRNCLATLAVTLDVEFLKIARVDKKTGLPIEEYSQGIKNRPHKKMLFSADSQAAYCLRIKKEVVVNDFSEPIDFVPSAQLIKAGAKSGVTTLLHIDDEHQGVLGVYSSKPRIYTTDEVNYIKSVSNILSYAIKRVESNELINQSERKYRLIFKESPIPLWIYDVPSLKFIDVNDAAIKHYGYSRNEFMGMKITDIRPQEDVPKLLKDIKSKTIGSTHKKIWRHLNKNGELMQVEISSNPINLSGNNYRLILANDVTRRTVLEAERERYQEHLENTVQHRTSQLLASNHELEAFNYTVSHDLRTPIRAIQMFAALLNRDCVTRTECKEYVQNIKVCTDEMTALINDLLEFSKLRNQEIKLIEIDMDRLAHETSNYLLSLEGGHDINIKIAKLGVVKGDETLLKSVWQNLISNAIKYSKKSAKINIDISAEKHNEMITYCIEDNGIGFDMKYASKLFKPFSRIHSSSEYKGTGAGLAIVERIVSRHNGTVWAESVPNKGSKFYFSIPTSN